MKSMMQEATSVIKAIEKAWDSAGKPKDFSIKVFQEPKKNFIGLTVENAKIGIFFDEKEEAKPESHQGGQRQPAPVRKQPSRAGLQEHRPKELRPLPPKTRPSGQVKPQPKPASQEQSEERKGPERILWNETMIALAQEWLKGTLASMNLSAVPFKTEVHNYHLKITFEAALAPDQEKERDIFRSFAFLMMQTLRHKLKRPLRGFKVVLTRAHTSEAIQED